MYRVWLTLVLLATATLAHGQLAVEVQYGLGRHIPILAEGYPDIVANSPQWTVSVGYRSDEAQWSQLYGKPLWHTRLSYQTLGNDQIFGSAVGLSTGLLFDMTPSGRWQLTAGGTLGLAYLDRPYDVVDNATNPSIGTHLNAMATLEARVVLLYLPGVRLGAALSAEHYSNSDYSEPNIGVNIASGRVFLQLDWSDEPPRFAMAVDTSYAVISILPPSVDRNIRLWQPYLRLSGGLTERGIDGPKYAVYGVGGGMSYRHSLKHRWSLGIDYIFDRSAQRFQEHIGVPSDEARRESRRLALMGGHEFVMGRIGLVTEVGLYFTDHYARRTIIPTRLGLQFYPLQSAYGYPHYQSYIGLYVHAYSGEAEYPELAVGVAF